MRRILALIFACVGMVSCGGGGGSGGGGTCAQIGTAVCSKACSCRDGAACAISQGGLTTDFPSEADCRGFFVTLGCSMGDKAAYNDAMACLPLIQAATCTGSGADGALSYPTDPACDSP